MPSSPRSELRAPPAGGLSWRALLVLFFLALLVRGAVATELGQTPLYRHPQLDAMEFLEWGRAIAAGDFRFPAYPTHGPVYPFFLGALLALFDGSPAAVRWVQSALGASTVLLAALLAARFWGRGAGLGAGLLLAFYGPLAFIETALWEEVLLLLLLLAFLHALSVERPSAARAAAAGGLLGLAALVRPTALVLLPAGAALVAWRGRRRWAAAAALAACCALVVAPVVAAVSHSVGTFLLVRGFGAINLYIGNDPAGGGTQNARLGGTWDRLEAAPLREGLGMDELEGYYTKKTVERIAAQPAAFAGVLASKLLWLTQAEEVRDNHSFYFFRRSSLALRWLPGFGLLLPLAVYGLWAAWKSSRLPPLLAAYLVLMAGTVVATLMGMRYRIPLIPVLAIFAGLGASTLVEHLRQRRRRALMAGGVLIAAVALFAQLRQHPPSHNLAEEWALTGSALVQAGELDAADDAFTRAIEADPRSALGWDGRGQIAVRRGDLAAAREAFTRAVEVDPGFRRSHFHLGQVLAHGGETDRAIAELEAAVAISPRYFLALKELGPLLVARGDTEKAARVFRQTLEAAPDHLPSLVALARLEGAARRPAEAVRFARRAAELSPRDPEIWLLLGFLALDAEDPATAAEAAARAADLLGRGAPQVLLLEASLQRSRGEGAAALATLETLLRQQPRLNPAVRLFLRTAEELGRRAEAERFLQQLRHGGGAGAGETPRGGGGEPRVDSDS